MSLAVLVLAVQQLLCLHLFFHQVGDDKSIPVCICVLTLTNKVFENFCGTFQLRLIETCSLPVPTDRIKSRAKVPGQQALLVSMPRLLPESLTDRFSLR